jgi:lipopolysaccharide biosynthesis regulator YciM
MQGILKKRLIIQMLLILSMNGVFAQSNDFETIMKNGAAEYELGNYEEALNFFKQAYRYDKNSNQACYEMALTYLSLGQNEDAAVFSGKIISRGGEYQEDAYLINCSAWENLGREKRAEKLYREGLKKHPGNYLLHYNLALLLYNGKEYATAQSHVIRAIELEPAHASSHLLLAYVMFDQGVRVQSMLPLYYFLLIEQGGDRSSTAYDLLTALWEQGVRMKGRRDIKLVKAGYNYSEFGQVELAMSQIKSEDKELSEDDENYLVKFAEDNTAFFKILSEVSMDKKGFWWEFYVDFFSKLDKNNMSEPFSYFISSCKYNNEVLLWLSDHEEAYQRFTLWMELY